MKYIKSAILTLSFVYIFSVSPSDLYALNPDEVCSKIKQNWKDYGVKIKGAKVKVSNIAKNACVTVYGKDCTYTSGYRSPSHNEKVGGAKRSQHLQANAVDLAPPPVKPASEAKLKKHQLILALVCGLKFTNGCMGGLGVYKNGSIHIDIRKTRSIWTTGYTSANIPYYVKDKTTKSLMYNFRSGALCRGLIQFVPDDPTHTPDMQPVDNNPFSDPANQQTQNTGQFSQNSTAANQPNYTGQDFTKNYWDALEDTKEGNLKAYSTGNSFLDTFLQNLSSTSTKNPLKSLSDLFDFSQDDDNSNYENSNENHQNNTQYPDQYSASDSSKADKASHSEENLEADNYQNKNIQTTDKNSYTYVNVPEIPNTNQNKQTDAYSFEKEKQKILEAIRVGKIENSPEVKLMASKVAASDKPIPEFYALKSKLDALQKSKYSLEKISYENEYNPAHSIQPISWWDWLKHLLFFWMW